jgi:hypothetical protein
MPLNILPARVPIGVVSDDGTVLMTTEFSRFLSGFLDRVGGPSGMGNEQLLEKILSLPSIVEQSAVPVSLTGTTVEKVMARVIVPAESMGRYGAIRITTLWSMKNSELEKKIVTRFAGADISSSVVSTVTTYTEQRSIYNRGTSDRQVFIFGGAGYTGQDIGTLSVSTTANQVIEIVAQLPAPAELITLEAYTVELLPRTA